jgi:hypothetical protein
MTACVPEDVPARHLTTVITRRSRSANVSECTHPDRKKQFIWVVWWTSRAQLNLVNNLSSVTGFTHIAWEHPMLDTSQHDKERREKTTKWRTPPPTHPTPSHPGLPPYCFTQKYVQYITTGISIFQSWLQRMEIVLSFTSYEWQTAVSSSITLFL